MHSIIGARSSNKHSVITKLLCSSSKHPTAGNIEQTPLFVELVHERNFSLICRILADPATPEEWISFGAELYATEAPTPLHLLCLHQPNPAVVKATLKALWTCDLHVDAQGRTPLHVAVQQGVRAEVVQLLLGDEFTSAAAVQDVVHLRYPLHYACCGSRGSATRITRPLSRTSKVHNNTAANNHLLTVRHLLAVYPEAVHKVDRDGRTPLDLARANNDLDPRILSSLERTFQMLDHRTNFDAGVSAGQWHPTPPHNNTQNAPPRSHKTFSSKVNHSSTTTSSNTADTTDDWCSSETDSCVWPVREVAPAMYIDHDDDLSSVGSRGVSHHPRPGTTSTRQRSFFDYSCVDL